MLSFGPTTSAQKKSYKISVGTTPSRKIGAKKWCNVCRTYTAGDTLHTLPDALAHGLSEMAANANVHSDA